MKLKLFYSLFVLMLFSCKPESTVEEKVKKIAVRTFTGKGENDETVHWFYIKNVVERGFSGYYLETTSQVNNFKQSHFTYSNTRPQRFKEQVASEEKIYLIDPTDLPDTVLSELPALESIYE